MSRKREDALFSAHAILSALQGSIQILRWGMLALVAVYLASGITVVKPSDVGLIVRFGRVLPEIHQPGLMFAFPEPADAVVTVPVKTVQEFVLDDWVFSGKGSEAGSGRALLDPILNPYSLTGDANIVQARFVMRYQVSDPIAYAFSVKDRDSLCKAIGYQAACETLAGMTIDDALATKRDFAARQALSRAQTVMDHLGLGIRLLAFELPEINPPVQVLPAFQDVVSAQVQAKTLVEPAKANRTLAIAAAKSQAFSMKQKADAERQDVLAKAMGSSVSFGAIFKEFQAHPSLVEARLYTEAMSEALPQVRVSMVVPSGADGIRLLLSPQAERQDGSKPMPRRDASPAYSGPATAIPPPDSH